ncbi:MAG: hypothetical protein Rubg2KO_35390 [Rubricoccaceae bacterium]
MPLSLMSALPKANTRAFAVAVVLAISVSASAQTDPRVVVEVGAIAQDYPTGTDQTISELTIPVRASAAVISGLEVSARTTYASVSGDDLESLSGIGDTQLGANFRQPVGGGLVDLSLMLSLPTGQTALSEEQFATASVLALDDYAFALPSFGQGMVFAPGLTIAVPVGSGLAFGGGVSYSMSSDYTPFADASSTYTPADETILTGGLDASLGGDSRFTLEGSYVLYGDDTFEGETFSPGDKVAGRMRLALGSGAVRGSFLARYRQVGDGTIGTPLRPVTYLRPNQAQVALGLSFVQSMFDIGISSGVRFYGSIDDIENASRETALAGQQVLLDLTASPTVRISPNATLMGSFTYTRGLGEEFGASPFTGTRAGAGVRVSL